MHGGKEVGNDGGGDGWKVGLIPRSVTDRPIDHAKLEVGLCLSHDFAVCAFN